MSVTASEIITDTTDTIDMSGVDPEIAHRYLKEIDEELERSKTRSSISTGDIVSMAKKIYPGLKDDHPEFNRAALEAIELVMRMRNVTQV